MDLQPMERNRIAPVASTRSDFTNFVDHPVKIDHFSWTAATTASVRSTDLVFSLWKGALPTTMAKKIASFWYMRAKIKIRVVVQGAAQAYGQMNLAFTPRIYAPHIGSVYSYVDDSSLIENCRIVPHITIDPSKSQTYELILPVPTPSGFYDLTSEDWGSYSYVSHIVNPLRSGTATSPTVNICVYMSLVDPEFEGLTTLIGNDFEDEKKPSDYVGSISYLSGVGAPLFGSFAPAVQLFSTVTGTVADVLRWFGFSKPPSIENNLIVLNRTADNYTAIEGVATNAVLGCSQKQSLSLDPSYGGGMMSEMAVSELFKKPAMIMRDLAVTSAASGESNVMFCVVSPLLSKIADADANSPQSPMFGLAALCAYWCGDLSFTFEFVASPFTRGTFLIAWDPYGTSTTAPSFADALAVLQHETVQVVGNTTTTIVIPYKNPMPALPFDDNSVSRVPLVPNVDPGSTDYANGMIYVYVVNPVVDNGGSGVIAINLWLHSDNMAYFGATNEFTTNHTMESTLFSFATSNVRLIGLDFEDEMAPTVITRFGPSTPLNDLHYRVFGDPIRSVKDIACRMDNSLGGTRTLGATSVGVTLKVPVAPPVTYSNPAATTTLNKASRFGWVAAAYLGYRGSIKYSYNAAEFPATSDVGSTIGRIFETARMVRSEGSTPATISDYTVLPANYYAYTTANLEVSSRGDIFCPMMIPLDFYPTRINFTTNIDLVQMNYRTGDLKVTGQVVTASALVGAGDDGVFVWFLGFPRLI